ncbi:sel1 repeat family protein [Pseudomonas sp. TH32]|uniref:sel1 repeat family protein n=1 Tax=unclassified Pseudomonas TaxID=196821 RepID=UPI0019148DA1|nr:MULTISPECIES: sel1 repeat family protein [unclassified Pseudomonas]MBK5438630.1 sel1 repeat family protein [Pseudomonas sp. TH32]MDF3202686.1 sel1 repeat family protein [Pseudomonas sp. 1912-s]
MYSHSDALTKLFDLLKSLSALISQLNVQQRAAKRKGLELYQLGEFVECETHLTIPASAGDAQSQFILGDAIRRREGTDSSNAQAWYRLAAAQEHVYALMRLGDDSSLATARLLAQAAADAGDGDAMLQMYELTQDQSWLRKAGDAGCAEAYYIAALLLDKTPDSDRQRDSMLRQSASKGFPPAMYWLGNMPAYYRNFAYQRTYLEKRLAASQLNSVMTYAAALAGGADPSLSRYDYPVNLTHAYGLYWLVMDSTRQNPRHTEAATRLRELASTLSPEQIEAAKAFGREWRASHPALSEFRLTYSELK